MSEDSARQQKGECRFEIQCEVCHKHFECTFDDPGESFSVTCPYCDTYYPEVYV